jgi:hypothetical protein
VSLTTVDWYQTRSGDTVTADVAVQAALDEAEALLEEATLRKFPMGRYEMELYAHQGPVAGEWKVYPPAVPVTSVAETSGARIETDRVVRVSWPDYDFIVEASRTQFVDLVWDGGWTADTFPAGLRRLTFEVARALIAESAASVDGDGLPAGAKSVRLGDAAVTMRDYDADGATALLEDLVPGISKRLHSWRLRT